MQIVKTQTDKLVVGSNDVSQPEGEKDQTPTGTAILNGPVVVGDGAGRTQGDYQGVLNVSSGSATQLPLDQQPKLNVNLAAAIDGNVRILGDGKTSNGLFVAGGSGPDVLFVTGDATFTGAVDCGNKGKLAERFGVADSKPKPFDLEHPTSNGIISNTC